MFYAGPMTAEEMPIFSRTYDFLTWLLPATNHFPRAHRHDFTRRLLDAPNPIPSGRWSAVTSHVIAQTGQRLGPIPLHPLSRRGVGQLVVLHRDRRPLPLVG